MCSLRRVSAARISTPHGDFTAYAYQSVQDSVEHIAFVRGDVTGEADVLVRVHSECLTGDVFGSLRCDCGPQLQLAVAKIADEGRGVVIYLRGHEGRGIGIGHKLRAYRLQEQGLDTVEANLELGFAVDSRHYGVGVGMLADLGITSIRLMTNNPAKCRGLSAGGLSVSERVPIVAGRNPENVRYLRTKEQKLGHVLGGGDLLGVPPGRGAKEPLELADEV